MKKLLEIASAFVFLSASYLLLIEAFWLENTFGGRTLGVGAFAVGVLASGVAHRLTLPERSSERPGSSAARALLLMALAVLFPAITSYANRRYASEAVLHRAVVVGKVAPERSPRSVDDPRLRVRVAGREERITVWHAEWEARELGDVIDLKIREGALGFPVVACLDRTCSAAQQLGEWFGWRSCGCPPVLRGGGAASLPPPVLTPRTSPPCPPAAAPGAGSPPSSPR